jgi:uncharacterized protein (TIGR02265 family)
MPAVAMLDDFVGPAFDAPISLEAHLEECRPDATTLGTFFQYVYNALARCSPEAREAACERLPVRRWIPFKQYPLRDYLPFAYQAARVLHPGVPLGEGLRRVGALSYPSFASTMAGRVVLFAFGERLDDVITAAGKSYRLALPAAQVHQTRVGERHHVFEIRDVPTFLEVFHCGVIEGAIRAHGYEPNVRFRRYSRRSDGDFDIRWSGSGR